MTFELTVSVNGRPVTQFFDKNGKKFIEGRPKTPFSIKLENKFDFPVLAVISIDGKNLVMQDTNWKSGIVIERYGIRNYNEWVGLNIPLTFNKVKMTNMADGVIGCRVYTREKEHKSYDKNVYIESHIYYDDLDGLKERGVILDKKFYYPNPFP